MLDFEAIQLAADLAALREWAEELRSQEAAVLADSIAPEMTVKLLDFASLLERTIARL
jgi:hypothetical protein